jgi:hypothetical protein
MIKEAMKDLINKKQLMMEKRNDGVLIKAKFSEDLYGWVMVKGQWLNEIKDIIKYYEEVGNNGKME